MASNRESRQAEDSDCSLDSEGYDKQDPFAEAAKRVDKQARARQELANSKIE